MYFRMETQAKDLVQEFEQEVDQVVGKSKVDENEEPPPHQY